MPMGAAIIMAETMVAESSRTLLRLLAWMSPAFPTGGFAYSHGIEWAVECGAIIDEATLLEWLKDVVEFGAGRTDTILLRRAYKACRDRAALEEIAVLGLATAAGRERHLETLTQGQAFVRAAQPWGMPSMPEDVPYPVAVGVAAGCHQVEEDAAALGYVQAFSTNLISAAVRLVPLGQSAGLRVLVALEPAILRCAEETQDTDDLGGCCFQSDIASMRHETQYTRLFRS
jgi:urease accessory protein